MNKNNLLKNLKDASIGNFFTVEIKKIIGDGYNSIGDMAKELELDGKIKIRAVADNGHSVCLHGLIKYASE
ncbi:hypothetical protein [Peribacillus sp. SCS-155]|uniref:hypothetical protein n=1 Tax=Peribacillus sedimenti TaxID=3115297 RepID=UPI00390620E4